MENIKFRAWDKKENKMFYDVQKEHDANITSYDSFGQVIEYLDIMQYSWLMDKNWSEIREGDLVIFDRKDLVSYVVFRGGQFTVRRPAWPYWPPHLSEWRVIGNIYENKDLIPKWMIQWETDKHE